MVLNSFVTPYRYPPYVATGCLNIVTGSFFQKQYIVEEGSNTILQFLHHISLKCCERKDFATTGTFGLESAGIESEKDT
jgi:hypothetical protein